MYVCSYLSLSFTSFPSHLPPLPVCPQVAEPLLPYALAFAAGAMVFVVVDDIIPEGHSWYVLLFISCSIDTHHVPQWHRAL